MDKKNIKVTTEISFFTLVLGIYIMLFWGSPSIVDSVKIYLLKDCKEVQEIIINKVIEEQKEDEEQ